MGMIVQAIIRQTDELYELKRFRAMNGHPMTVNELAHHHDQIASVDGVLCTLHDRMGLYSQSVELSDSYWNLWKADLNR